MSSSPKRMPRRTRQGATRRRRAAAIDIFVAAHRLSLAWTLAIDRVPIFLLSPALRPPDDPRDTTRQVSHEGGSESTVPRHG